MQFVPGGSDCCTVAVNCGLFSSFTSKKVSRLVTLILLSLLFVVHGVPVI